MATISNHFYDVQRYLVRKKTAVNSIYPHKLFSNNDSYNKYITKEKFPKKSPE